MDRICRTSVAMGNEVLLVGRKRPHSQPLADRPYAQKRFSCIFEKGIWFYLEYNIRLIFFLLKHSFDLCYSVDVDTGLGALIPCLLKRKKLIHDAHEYFVELPELTGHPIKKRIWNMIAKWVNKVAEVRITVNKKLAEELQKKYGYDYQVIMNVPLMKESTKTGNTRERTLYYQGMLNVGRGLEEAILSLPHLPEEVTLTIVGKGDIEKKLKKMVKDHNLQKRVRFLGWKSPQEMYALAGKCMIGLNMLNGDNLNYRYSLANKFFDYMHMELPQVTMKYPAYQDIIKDYQVGVMIENLEVREVVKAIKKLLDENKFYEDCVKACREAKKEYHWEKEAKKILHIWN